MKINLVGWYGHKNIGDECFRDVFSQCLSKHDLVFSEVPDLTADAIILGGGGVVCGKYLTGLENYQGILYALGVDIAVNGQVWEKIKTLPFKAIYARSREYVQIATEQAQNVFYCPDLAFNYWKSGITDLGDWRKDDVIFKTGKKLGIIVSRDAEHTTALQHLASLTKMVGPEFTEVVFVSLYGEDLGSDQSMNEIVAQNCGLPYKFMKPTSTAEAIDTVNSLDFLVSMRFHGVIFAVMTGIPFVALANKGKCSLFCEQEGLFEHYVELKEVTDYKLRNRLKYIGKQSGKWRQLLSVASRNRVQVCNVFKSLEL